MLSDVRSGSTLLDQLLGAHPMIVSVGELHWLTAYVRQDRKIYDPVHPLVCTCGKPVVDCPFWAKVQSEVARPLDSLLLRPKFSRWRGRNGKSLRDRATHFPTRVIQAVPRLYRYSLVQRFFGGSVLARDSIELADAILRVTGKKFLVDSSKSVFKFRTVYDAHAGSTRAIVLVRDYRAVVHSKMKRGLSLEESAIGWQRKMIQIESLTDDLKPQSIYKVKYESLCSNPETEMANICQFLGLKFENAVLTRPTEDVHHIGGSPSKFDPARKTISLDIAYRDAFNAEALKTIRRLVGDVAVRWGYCD